MKPEWGRNGATLLICMRLGFEIADKLLHLADLVSADEPIHWKPLGENSYLSGE